MKNKLFAYLMVGMIAVTGISTIAPSMTVYAITQDEQSEYNRYMQWLLDQGYSMDEIDRFVINNTDGTIRNGLPLLKQAVENGTLKKAGATQSPVAEEPKKTETTGNAEQNPVHEHQYSANLTTNPTCTEEGVMTYTCSCGDSYTEPYPKLEHQYEKEITREATCAEEGETIHLYAVRRYLYRTDR